MRLSPLFIIYVHPFVREDLKIDLLFKDSLFVLHKKKCVPSVTRKGCRVKVIRVCCCAKSLKYILMIIWIENCNYVGQGTHDMKFLSRSMPMAVQKVMEGETKTNEAIKNKCCLYIYETKSQRSAENCRVTFSI